MSAPTKSKIPISSVKKQTRRITEQKKSKINQAKPAPDFTKLHSQWQDKLKDGLAKAKKPSTVPQLAVFGGHKSKSLEDNFVKEEKVVVHKSRISGNSAHRSQSVYKKTEKVVDESARRKSLHKMKFQSETCEFTADPSSLAQILKGTSSQKKRDDPPRMSRPRMSVYDVISLKQKQRELSEVLEGRTPLKDVINTMVHQTGPIEKTPSRARMSVYDARTAKQSAKRSALKTSEKKRREVIAESVKKLTWSQLLTRSKNFTEIEDELKQVLFMDTPTRSLFTEEDEEDADNQSLLLRIQEAEQHVETHWPKQQGKSPLGNMNSTYVTRPAKGRFYSPEIEDQKSHLSVFDCSDKSYQKSPITRADSPMPYGALTYCNKLMPHITGISRLADTPKDQLVNDSVSNLFDNLNINSNKQEMNKMNYCSPVLSSKKTLNKSSHEVLTPEIKTPVKPVLEKTHTYVAQLLPTLEPQKTLEATGIPQVAEILPPDKLSETCEYSLPSTSVNLDYTFNISNPNDEIIPVTQTNIDSNRNTSPELVKTLQTIDKDIKKSRRRSAALAAVDSPACNSDLLTQLQQILAQQQRLEQQRLLIQKKLAFVRSPFTSKDTAAKTETTCAEPSLLLQNLNSPSNSSSVVCESSVVEDDVNLTVVKQFSDNSTIVAAHIELEADEVRQDKVDDISFLPPPSDLQRQSGGLQSISTACFKDARRSKGRESLKPMTFASVLENIDEQKSNECADNEAVCSVPPPSSTHCDSQWETTSTKHGNMSESILINNNMIGPMKNACSIIESTLQSSPAIDDIQMEVTDCYEPTTNPIYISETGGPSIPVFTPINHSQGKHLIANIQSELAATSPRSLQLQSKHISNIDCIQKGLSSKHYETLLSELETANTQYNQLKQSVHTPCAEHIGGTIRIHSGDSPAYPYSSSQATALNASSSTKIPSNKTLFLTCDQQSSEPAFISDQQSSEPAFINVPVLLPETLSDSNISTNSFSSTIRHTPSPLTSADKSVVHKLGNRSINSSSPDEHTVESFNSRFKAVGSQPHKDGTSQHQHTLLNVSEKYKEALLDEEVAIYMCRSRGPSVRSRERPVDPVAECLMFGDSTHFIPIEEEKKVKLVPVIGSAFCYIIP